MAEFEDFRDEVRDSILRDYPNPTRAGCPDPAVIEALARKALPPDSASARHVLHCSPCYRDFLDHRRRIRRNRVLKISTAAAICVLVAAAAAFWAIRTENARPAQEAELNLRNRPIFRGLEPNRETAPPALVLPRRRLHLSVVLPFGSDPGPYQMELRRNANSEPAATAAGTARIQDGSTLLPLEVNFSRLPAGNYILGIRKDAWAWNYYSVALH